MRSGTLVAAPFDASRANYRRHRHNDWRRQTRRTCESGGYSGAGRFRRRRIGKPTACAGGDVPGPRCREDSGRRRGCLEYYRRRAPTGRPCCRLMGHGWRYGRKGSSRNIWATTLPAAMTRLTRREHRSGRPTGSGLCGHRRERSYNLFMIADGSGAPGGDGPKSQMAARGRLGILSFMEEVDQPGVRTPLAVSATGEPRAILREILVSPFPPGYRQMADGSPTYRTRPVAMRSTCSRFQDLAPRNRFPTTAAGLPRGHATVANCFTRWAQPLEWE